MSKEELLVVVDEGDFDLALKNLIPSVSDSEMEHYTKIKRHFSTFE
jgi:peroxin-6